MAKGQSLLSQVRMLNIQGEWLYFIGSDGIYKMRTDGSSLKQLAYNTVARQLLIMNNWLFYNTDDGIYRMQIDRKGAMPIRILDNPNIYQFTVSKGWVYYKESSNSGQAGTIGRIRINGTDNLNYGSLDYEDLTVHEDYIYFNYIAEDKAMIGRIPVEGGRLQNLAIAEGFNISDNKLYFSKGYSLYQSNLDGTDSKKVAQLGSWPMPMKLIILDGSVYYEKDASNEKGEFVSAMYSMNLTTQLGNSLYGKTLPSSNNVENIFDEVYPLLSETDSEKEYEVKQAAKAVVEQTVLPDMTTREK